MQVVSPPPAAPPTTQAPTPDRVVIVGAGPAGMATALELADNGVPSVVLEKRGMVGTRQPLFAVIPPFADRLAALDKDGSLTGLLTPMGRMVSTHEASGRSASRDFEGDLAPDPTRSRGDIDALVRAAGPPDNAGADRRRWAFAGIDAVENGLRELARTKYADLIEIRPDSGVAAIRQGADYAEAVLEPSADGAARDAVRGAMLIDASGRDILGGARTTYPEQAFWVGARFAGDTIHGTDKVRSETPTGERSTIALRSADRTIVWTQVDDDPTKLDPAVAKQLVQERAAKVGVTEQLPEDARTMPVTVQLWTSGEPAAGRVLKVGDSVRAPYFMTSTGAATALIHDAPKAVDTVLAVRGGTPVEQASAAYADAVRAANDKLIQLVRPVLQRDVSGRQS